MSKKVFNVKHVLYGMVLSSYLVLGAAICIHLIFFVSNTFHVFIVQLFPPGLVSSSFFLSFLEDTPEYQDDPVQHLDSVEAD